MTPSKIGRIAAAVLVIALSLFVVFNRFLAFNTDNSLTGNEEKEIQNTGLTLLKVTLEDGSTVSLEPGSQLNYVPGSFTGKRELRLTGEAFFEVVKDKKHPFLVFTSGITTKVLGTSFRIKAYREAKEIVVSVSTGRVAVFKQHGQEETKRDEQAEVILTPNQQFVYNRTDDKTEKKLIEDPQIVLAEPSLKAHYTNVAVAEVFETLEENYGVVIEYDKEVLAHCSITTTLANEGLYEKVDIICQAIGAQYRVNGTSIVIESSGCD
jgi:ferric-dicitrate binding protein FerR (iron transport regulator)